MRGAKLFAALIILVMVISPGLVTHSMSCWQQFGDFQYMVEVRAIGSTECISVSSIVGLSWDKSGHNVKIIDGSGENLRSGDDYVYEVIVWIGYNQLFLDIQADGYQTHEQSGFQIIRVLPYRLSRTDSPYNTGLTLIPPE